MFYLLRKGRENWPGRRGRHRSIVSHVSRCLYSVISLSVASAVASRRKGQNRVVETSSAHGFRHLAGWRSRSKIVGIGTDKYSLLSAEVLATVVHITSPRGEIMESLCHRNCFNQNQKSCYQPAVYFKLVLLLSLKEFTIKARLGSLTP